MGNAHSQEVLHFDFEGMESAEARQNLVSVVNWLESCTDYNILKQTQHEMTTNGIIITPEYVQSVAAAMWSIAGKGDLSEIATPNLIRKLFQWSVLLESTTELKAAVDHAVCSVCCCSPWLFLYLMHCMEILKPKEFEFSELDIPMDDLLYMWYESGCYWDNVIVRDMISLENVLNSGILITLGKAAQSQMSSNILHMSQLLVIFNEAILDFCSYYTNNTITCNEPSCDDLLSTFVLSHQLLIGILSFYTELCSVNEFKNWFGFHASRFWLPLLKLVSTLSGNQKSVFFGSNVNDMESVIIRFLVECCRCHHQNQKIVATCLRELLSNNSTATTHEQHRSMSSFCRRLAVRLLLEDEKVLVLVKNTSNCPLKIPVSTLPLKDWHPSIGFGASNCFFYLSVHSKAYELMKLIEPFGVSQQHMILVNEEFPDIKIPSNISVGVIGAAVDNQNPFRFLDILVFNFRVKVEVATSSKRKSCAEIEISPVKESTFEESVPAIFDIAPLPSTIDAFSREGGLMLLAKGAEGFYEEMLVRTAATSTKSPVAKKSTAAMQSASPHLVQSPLKQTAKKPTAPKGIAKKSTASKQKATNTTAANPIPAIPTLPLLPPLPPVLKHQLPAISKLSLPSYLTATRQIPFTPTTSYNPTLYGPGMFLPASYYPPPFIPKPLVPPLYNLHTSFPTSSNPTLARQSQLESRSIPLHSMAAFKLFLRLPPKFSEVLLRKRLKAQCMLRLLMGVADDSYGNDILKSTDAKKLSMLPYQVLRLLLDDLPLNTNDGLNVRTAMVDVRAIHYILAHLAVFTHQTCDPSLMAGFPKELFTDATKDGQNGSGPQKRGRKSTCGSSYMAKGTGYGSGTTQQSCNIELAIEKKKTEEENACCLLDVLSSLVYPQKNCDEGRDVEYHMMVNESCTQLLPPELVDVLKNSCVFPAIAAFLRNDSVLDIARHISLYKSVLQCIRSLVSSSQLLPLLASWEKQTNSGADEQGILCLLCHMKDAMENYAKTLFGNSNVSGNAFDDDDEALAFLIADIQSTVLHVENYLNLLRMKQGNNETQNGPSTSTYKAPIQKSLEQRYLETMKKLQFAFYEMICEEGGALRFSVAYHYEQYARAMDWSRSFPARLKRLAQESVTLSTSLPLSYGSTIFVRCDNDRLDVMKVLITGPADTPYSNGCFEFDVFFPSEYPKVPMNMNLRTTGRNRVRFNPNLYESGKVCLSILNTWTGRPEEQWNPQTSSLLPVLVAIQALIFNAEPYFNEPGFQSSNGTPVGKQRSKEYNEGIEKATVEWAMLDQIRYPTVCFKEIIHTHFWMKKEEIIAQCETWLKGLGRGNKALEFKNNLDLLKKELMDMQTPAHLQNL